MEKLKIEIKNLNLICSETLAELLESLWQIEDELMYECKSVSKTIDKLQNILEARNYFEEENKNGR